MVLQNLGELHNCPSFQSLFQVYLFLYHQPFDFVDEFSSQQRVSESKRYISGNNDTILNIDQSARLFAEICPTKEALFTKIATTKVSMDFALLIVFNEPHYEAIPIIEILYRPLFKALLYCGPEYPSLSKFPMLKGYRFSFVQYKQASPLHLPGSNNYVCIQLAYSLLKEKENNNLKGILFMADDILFNFWNMMLLDRHKPWYSTTGKIWDVETGLVCKSGRESPVCNTKDNWVWYDANRYRMKKVLHRLSANDTLVVYRECGTALKSFTGSRSRAIGRQSGDFYYLPFKMAATFSELLVPFYDETIFLEIAVPTLIQCISETVEHLTGGDGLWSADRNEVWRHYPIWKYKSHVHPAKLGKVMMGDKTFVDFFCGMVLEEVSKHV